MSSVLACPRCAKPVEAKDYMNPMLLGALESVLPRITCTCGYRGLPISFSREDYGRWLDERGGTGRRP
jgi:hypothetical protein